MLSGIHGLTPNMPIRSGKTFKRRITSSSACYVSNSSILQRQNLIVRLLGASRNSAEYISSGS